MDLRGLPGTLSAPFGVFILDDHGMARDSIRMACRSRPNLNVVGEAADAREGLRLIRELHPDVLVLDIVLPGMDGLEVARRLRDEGFAGRILVVTGTNDEDVIFASLLLDADGFIPKTAGLEEIADAIEAVAAGTTVFDGRHKRLVSAKIVGLARRARQTARISATLTKRERQTLNLLARGLTTRQVAQAISISERTAETHIANLYRKLAVRTRVQAVNRAHALGLVKPDPVQDPGDGRSRRTQAGGS
jgi:DNA-binding NarL/FixJ family response regulator